MTNQDVLYQKLHQHLFPQHGLIQNIVVTTTLQFRVTRFKAHIIQTTSSSALSILTVKIH